MTRRSQDWRAGKPRPCPGGPAWYDLVREHTARGVEFRRARIVSEPLADYIRFEYESTAFNVAAGETVRWLPRHAAPGLLRAAADFWLFDDRLVRFGFFAGDGSSCGRAVRRAGGGPDVRGSVRAGLAPGGSARRVPARLTLVMAISPSSSVQRAREQLAERLRDIRLDARLTARALSAAAGWHEAKTSRIESAKKAPSEDDIRAWCRVCGAERDVPDLIAASRSADSMYIEWRRLHPRGCGGTRRPAPAARADKAAQGLLSDRRPWFPPDARSTPRRCCRPSGISTGRPMTWPMPWRPDAAQAPRAVGQPPVRRPRRRGRAAAGSAVRTSWPAQLGYLLEATACPRCHSE